MCLWYTAHVKPTNPFALAEKELVYPSSDGYVVYDRLMAECLRGIGR